MKVHFIAIGGSAMHNLAIALAKKNYEVSGSDDEIFEPSRSRLKKYGLLPDSRGWNESKIHKNLDFVVLGMHARADNPELIKARSLGLKVLSYPEFLFQQSKDKTRVVIAGSHGKTTITAMVLHVLHYHDVDCDYMVGAQLEGFDTMVKLTEHNEFILLEGDEYLSSPLDPQPKFIHYRPNICLISGIAWDHVNVFKTYDEYYEQFLKLMDVIEPGGAVIYNELDPEVKNLVENSKRELKKFPYGLPVYAVKDGKLSIESDLGEVPLQIFGRHNLNNLEGARWICNQMGIDNDAFFEAIAGFKGASRRLEKIIDRQDLKLFRDFAHAPSKVEASTKAVAETFPESRFIACLELHTFSSLNKEFLNNYTSSLDSADLALVYFNPDVVAHKKLPHLSKDDVINSFGADVEVFNDNRELISRIQNELSNNSTLLIMSSGDFDGINWKEEFEKNSESENLK